MYEAQRFGPTDPVHQRDCFKIVMADEDWEGLAVHLHFLTLSRLPWPYLDLSFELVHTQGA